MENEQNKNKITEIFIPRETTTTNGPLPEIEAPQTKSTGAIIGSIIIIIVLIIGGLYLWGKQIIQTETQISLTPEQILSETDPALDSLNTQGTSTKITNIEADLNTTDLNNLDKELKNIDTELGL
ncbi:MAG: hypothetical protein Athens071416_271 [Parcubacteria group bacterium Athens0714_16]|nr:MAG: hypothetical protein Athens071416_271 [Parcubacteria group bacterium Athens0714_16]